MGPTPSRDAQIRKDGQVTSQEHLAEIVIARQRHAEVIEGLAGRAASQLPRREGIEINFGAYLGRAATDTR